MPGQTGRSRALEMSGRLPHYVYRCFDADGDLIYIGCTSNVARRIGAHRRGEKAASRWIKHFYFRHEVEGPFPTRAAGLEAEAAAIQRERPVFNMNSTGLARWAHNDIAAYLIERGRLALAVETACRCWRETRAAGACDSWCTAHVAEGVLPIWEWSDPCEGVEDGAA